jgi:two-component system sensor histidine kinase UhpB
MEQVVFWIICVFLLIVLAGSVWKGTVENNHYSRDFLVAWMIILVIGLMLVNDFDAYSKFTIPVALMGLFVYIIKTVDTKRPGTDTDRRKGGRRYSDREIEQLQELHREVRRVLDATRSRVEEEMKYLSRQLHDEINPNLLFIRNKISELECKIKEGKITDPDAIIPDLERLFSLVKDAYVMNREIIKSIRTEIIDNIGFKAALGSLVTQFSNLFDKPMIRLDMNLPEKPEITCRSAITAYHIIREALYNAVKHASAEVVVVSIKQEGARYKVEVRDNGIGIAAQRKSESGIGLIDMRERAASICQDFQIQPSNPNDAKRSGTTIRFSFEPTTQ